MQKLLDMIESNVVQVSAYHKLLDSSGMGLMQGEGKLPGYYAFDKIGELIADNNYFYNIESVVCDTANGEYRNSEITYSEVYVWGFGNESDLSEIVIANQTDSVKKFALKDYTLIKEWEYSAGAKPLSTNDRGFLEGDRYYSNMTEVTLPTICTVNADIVELPPYSIMVCGVKKSDSKIIITSNIADGETEVLVDSSVKLTVIGQEQINQENIQINLTSDNGIVPTDMQINGNTVMLIPKALLEYDKKYTVSGTVTGDSKILIDFKTAAKHDWEEYEDRGEIGGTFDDFVLTFDAVKELGENIVLKLRDKMVTFKDIEAIVTPPLSTGSNYISHLSLDAGIKTKVMVVAYGPQLDFYLRTDETGRFIKMGEITNANITPSTISVSGIGVSNVKIKINCGEVTNIKYSSTINGIKIPLAYPIGETKVEFSVNAEEYNIYSASYENNALKRFNVETNENNEYSIDLNSDSTLMQKIFIWADKQKPLRSTIKK